jgi:hypothetical protein
MLVEMWKQKGGGGERERYNRCTDGEEDPGWEEPGGFEAVAGIPEVVAEF